MAKIGNNDVLRGRRQAVPIVVHYFLRLAQMEEMLVYVLSLLSVKKNWSFSHCWSVYAAIPVKLLIFLCLFTSGSQGACGAQEDFWRKKSTPHRHEKV